MNKHLLNIIGNKDEILIEQTNETISKGKGQNFINVKLNEKIDVGKIVRCIYTGIKDDILLAKRI